MKKNLIFVSSLGVIVLQAILLFNLLTLKPNESAGSIGGLFVLGVFVICGFLLSFVAYKEQRILFWFLIASSISPIIIIIVALLWPSILKALGIYTV